jgi:hypothetical protein
MQALHGGTATTDTLDAHKIAALLRRGRLAPASGSPAQLRAPRDLLRRPTPRRRHRAALVSPVHTPPSPSTLPASGQQLASQAHRAGVAARVPAPAVPQTLAGDLSLITMSCARLAHSLASPPPSPTRPPPSLCSQPSPALARASASGCSMQATTARGAQASTRAPRPAAWSHGARQQAGNAGGRQASQAARPPSRGPALQPPLASSVPPPGPAASRPRGDNP